ncbi:hypothetical protein [Paracoccus alcaliphilus]|uniref:hypothetical protein n=1 Tax=Paracoccus alcaliphilus TaxID=34002 RepID=UPI00147FD004|nr:hypothetical protein [Paracoccus alcaliphilus]WCR17972.1 hypothetical protein JHW40_17025 [Paracoccus alcaliphilus]
MQPRHVAGPLPRGVARGKRGAVPALLLTLFASLLLLAFGPFLAAFLPFAPFLCLFPIRLAPFTLTFFALALLGLFLLSLLTAFLLLALLGLLLLPLLAAFLLLSLLGLLLLTLFAAFLLLALLGLLLLPLFALLALLCLLLLVVVALLLLAAFLPVGLWLALFTAAFPLALLGFLQPALVLGQLDLRHRHLRLCNIRAEDRQTGQDRGAVVNDPAHECSFPLGGVTLPYSITSAAWGGSKQARDPAVMARRGSEITKRARIYSRARKIFRT